jgi:hypothetical protein
MRVMHSIVPCTTRNVKGESTIALRFQHLIAQQRSYRIIQGTNNGILTIRASANTQNAARMILQNILSTMQGVLATNVAILTKTSKIIHYYLP